jgi:hypothetical protein
MRRCVFCLAIIAGLAFVAGPAWAQKRKQKTNIEQHTRKK